MALLLVSGCLFIGIIKSFVSLEMKQLCKAFSKRSGTQGIEYTCIQARCGSLFEEEIKIITDSKFSEIRSTKRRNAFSSVAITSRE